MPCQWKGNVGREEILYLYTTHTHTNTYTQSK